VSHDTRDTFFKGLNYEDQVSMFRAWNSTFIVICQNCRPSKHMNPRCGTRISKVRGTKLTFQCLGIKAALLALFARTPDPPIKYPMIRGTLFSRVRDTKLQSLKQYFQRYLLELQTFQTSVPWYEGTLFSSVWAMKLKFQCLELKTTLLALFDRPQDLINMWIVITGHF